MTFVQHEFSASDLLSLDPATRRLRSQSANAIFAARVLCVPLAGLTSCHVGMLGLGPEEESALAARESLYAGSDGGGFLASSLFIFDFTRFYRWIFGL